MMKYADGGFCFALVCCGGMVNSNGAVRRISGRGISCQNETIRIGIFLNSMAALTLIYSEGSHVTANASLALNLLAGICLRRLKKTGG